MNAAREYTATVTLDPDNNLTDESTVTVTNPTGAVVDAAPVIAEATIGGYPDDGMRVVRTLQTMGWQPRPTRNKPTGGIFTCTVEPL